MHCNWSGVWPERSFFSAGAQDGQHRVGQHGQSDVPFPTFPLPRRVRIIRRLYPGVCDGCKETRPARSFSVP